MTATVEKIVKPSVPSVDETPAFVTEVAVATMMKKAIGEIKNLKVLRVARVCGHSFRVNVYCFDDVADRSVIPSSHIAHSYFLTINPDGTVKDCIAEKGSKVLSFN